MTKEIYNAVLLKKKNFQYNINFLGYLKIKKIVFPEIPLIHLLTARITFGNIFGMDTPVSQVTTLKEDDRISCIVDDSVFEVPPGYTIMGKSFINFIFSRYKSIHKLFLNCNLQLIKKLIFFKYMKFFIYSVS